MKTRRRTRAEANAETEAAILRSAREHFERLGYHGASVEEIAEVAGFSKGAVYSRYRTRDDLFLAVLERSIDERQRQIEALPAELVGVDYQLVAVSQSAETLRWQAALIEFRIHAARDDRLNERYRELHERAVANVAGILSSAAARLGLVLERPARELAVAALAQTTGLVVESLVHPSFAFDDALAAMRELAVLTTTEPKEAP